MHLRRGDELWTRSLLPLVAMLGVLGSCLVAWGSLRGGDPVAYANWWLEDVPVLGRIPGSPDWLPFSLVDRPGVLALVVAWFLLRRLSLARAVSVRAVIVVAVVWTAPFLLAPPYWSGDVFVYVANGRLAERGLDPGEHPPSDLGDDEVIQRIGPGWLDNVTPYGPGATLVSEATVRLAGDSVAGAVLLWRLWAIVGVALLGLGVSALARSYGVELADALVLALAGPLTVLHLVGGVHNDALMVGLLTCALALSARRQSWGALLGAAALCGLAAGVKAPALAAAIYIGWTGGKPPLVPRRGEWLALPDRLAERAGRTVATVGVAVATIALLNLAAGTDWGWVGGLDANESIISVLSVSTTIGLLLARLTGAPLALETDVVRVTRSAFAASGVALAGVLLFLTPTLGLTGLAAAYGVVALFGLAVLPWYFTWSIAPASVALAGRRVWWPMVVAAGVVLLEGTNLALRPARLVAVVGVAVVAAAAWRWWSRRPREPERDLEAPPAATGR